MRQNRVQGSGNPYASEQRSPPKQTPRLSRATQPSLPYPMSLSTEEDSPAGHRHILASPSLSSSSCTPSSCNLDDIGSHDLSDVSSLDGSDFEIVDVVRRPASSLSSRSRDPAAETGGSVYDGSLLGDHTDQWASVPRYDAETDGERSAPSGIDDGPRGCGGGESDLSAILTEQDAAEADLLNRSLSSTFAISRHEHTASGSSTCVVTPQASVLHPDAGPPSAIVELSDATASVATSQFTFPDPLSLSQTEQDHAPLSADQGPTSEAGSIRASNELRRRWTPVPSEAKTRSVSDHPSERGWNRNRRAPQPPLTASSFGFSLSTFQHTSLGTAETESRLNTSVAPTPAGRPVRRTHIDLPASVNVYYLGRRPEPAVQWRISQAIKASLATTVERPLQPHSREVHDAVTVSRSAAGNAFGKRVLHLKEADCTLPRGATSEESAAIASYLRGPAARDVRDGNALVVCYLEGGGAVGSSPSAELPSHLASLLELVHLGLQPGSRADVPVLEMPKPLVLPVACPRSGKATDDAFSIASEGQREFVQQLASRRDAQAIDKAWSSILAETLRLLKAFCTAPHLHVQFAPGTAFVRVISFEALVSDSASWFRGDVTWACRAAMPLPTTTNSPLVLLQADAGNKEQSPAWMTKTRSWLSRSIQPSMAEGDGSLELGKTKERPEEKDDGESEVEVEADATHGDVERLSSRTFWRYRALRAMALVLSLCFCAAFWGSGTVPLTRMLRPASVTRTSSVDTLASGSAAPAASGLFSLSQPRNATRRNDDRTMTSNGVPSLSASASASSADSVRRRRQPRPSKSAELEKARGADSKALAAQGGADQETALSVARQILFLEPKQEAGASTPEPQPALHVEAWGEESTDSNRSNTSSGSSGMGGAGSGRSRHSLSGTVNVSVGERLVELLIAGFRHGSRALLSEARLSWRYWLLELWRVYREVVLPAKQLYAHKVSEAHLQAARMLRSACTASKSLAEKQQREASVLVADAVRGAGMVSNAASAWADSVADRLRISALGTRGWARSVLDDMTRGAMIAADAASKRFASNADDDAKQDVQAWLSQQPRRHDGKGSRLDQLRDKATEARGFTDRLWGTAMKRADEQLEYWFVADEP
ncbi:hypothetical protein ACQY0O_005394 [Thecaphora frezii]